MRNTAHHTRTAVCMAALADEGWWVPQEKQKKKKEKKRKRKKKADAGADAKEEL